MLYAISLPLVFTSIVGMIVTIYIALASPGKSRLYLVAINSSLTAAALALLLFAGNMPASAEFIQKELNAISPSARIIVITSLASRNAAGLGLISSRDFAAIVSEANRSAPMIDGLQTPAIQVPTIVEPKPEYTDI